jgi:serine/threonine-protein kinase RsbW
VTEADRVAVLETTTGPDTLDAIQRTLDGVWSAHEVSEMNRMRMDLAVGEVGANIIKHAANGESVCLTMEVFLSPDAATVTLSDDGNPAGVDLSAVSLPDELAEQGRGLAIALEVLDELAYRREGDGNRWTLVLRLI